MEKISNNINVMAPKIEIRYIPAIKPELLPQVSSPQEAFQIFLSTWDLGRIYMQEEFKVLFLSKARRVLAIDAIFAGGLSDVTVDPKLIFIRAINVMASAIVCAHNHPSGRLVPSDSDRGLTRKLVEAGKLLDIEVSDHLIISDVGYYSFADEGGI